jgi:hypothetical protein
MIPGGALELERGWVPEGNRCTCSRLHQQTQAWND